MRNRGGTRRASAAIAVALSLAALLAGCTPSPPQQTFPPPGPSPTPLFASDEEALAAATKAYAEYLRVEDLILSEGGRNPERLKQVARGDALDTELEGFALTRKRGWHTTGATRFDKVKLQKFDPDSHEQNVIVFYACIDVSGVDVVDSSGKSVVSAARPAQSAVQASFDFVGGRLILFDNREWTGGGVC